MVCAEGVRGSGAFGSLSTPLAPFSLRRGADHLPFRPDALFFTDLHFLTDRCRCVNRRIPTDGRDIEISCNKLFFGICCRDIFSPLSVEGFRRTQTRINHVQPSAIPFYSVWRSRTPLITSSVGCSDETRTEQELLTFQDSIPTVRLLNFGLVVPKSY